MKEFLFFQLFKNNVCIFIFGFGFGFVL